MRKISGKRIEGKPFVDLDDYSAVSRAYRRLLNAECQYLRKQIQDVDRQTMVLRDKKKELRARLGELNDLHTEEFSTGEQPMPVLFGGLSPDDDPL